LSAISDYGAGVWFTIWPARGLHQPKKGTLTRIINSERILVEPNLVVLFCQLRVWPMKNNSLIMICQPSIRRCHITVLATSP